MRIRNFKWSVDVVIPAASILLVIWGLLGDSTNVALGGGYLLVVTMLYLLSRAERIQADGSYGGLLSEEWLRWVDPTRIIFPLLGGTLFVGIFLLLRDVPPYLAFPAGGGLTIAFIVVIQWFRRIRRRE